MRGFFPPWNFLKRFEILKVFHLVSRGSPLAAFLTFVQLRAFIIYVEWRIGLGVSGLVLPIDFESYLPLKVL